MRKSKFAIALREWRKAQGLTQGGLAKLLGLGGATISRWENNTPPHRRQYAAAVAMYPAFGTEVPSPRTYARMGGAPLLPVHNAAASTPAPTAPKVRRPRTRATAPVSTPQSEFAAAIGGVATIKDAIVNMRSALQAMHDEMAELESKLTTAERRAGDAVAAFVAALKV